MAGLRERKKAAARAAIRDAGMRLFAQQGFAGTTIDQIAEAADVARATVFGYYATKEDIVFGDAPAAIGALAAALERRDEAGGTVAVVRGWLRQLTGWIEPELVLQLRLAREVPSVGARRLRTYQEVERLVAAALEVDLGPGRALPAQLAAAALVAALRLAEETAADRMAEDGRALGADEVDALFDHAVAFTDAGLAALAAR
jgi:AcrR family transcriptional regulator